MSAVITHTHTFEDVCTCVKSCNSPILNIINTKILLTCDKRQTVTTMFSMCVSTWYTEGENAGKKKNLLGSIIERHKIFVKDFLNSNSSRFSAKYIMFFRCLPDDDEIRRIMRAENTERMIKEKLMMGWTFHDLSCFVCDTPLVVNTTVSELPPEGTAIAKPTPFSAQAIGTFIKDKC